MSHVLTRPELAVCDAGKFASGIWEALHALQSVVSQSEEENKPPVYDELPLSVKRLLDDNVREHAPGVFAVRYLHPYFCRELVREFRNADWQVNEEEPVEARIPELVLEEVNYGVYQALRGLHKAYIKPLTQLLMGVTPDECKSIQMARYTIDNTPHGCWHTDRDSESTLVVALSDYHQGGGTEVYDGPYRAPIVIPQLQTGWAMLFNGRARPHMGLPVTEGTRNLLVHWYGLEN